MTDWDKELARIDKQLASLSDDKLLASADAQPMAQPAPPQQGKPAAARPAAPVSDRRARWGMMGRVVVAVALAVAVLFWPYGTSCGAPLFGYLGSLVVLTATGVLASVSTWKHRSAIGHVIALATVLWALVLASSEVLPRIGYAVVDAAQPVTWLCE